MGRRIGGASAGRFQRAPTDDTLHGDVIQGRLLLLRYQALLREPTCVLHSRPLSGVYHLVPHHPLLRAAFSGPPSRGDYPEAALRYTEASHHLGRIPRSLPRAIPSLAIPYTEKPVSIPPLSPLFSSRALADNAKAGYHPPIPGLIAVTIDSTGMEGISPRGQGFHQVSLWPDLHGADRVSPYTVQHPKNRKKKKKKPAHYPPEAKE